MTHGEMMLEAVRHSFPAVNALCEASFDEYQNLLITFGMLPEKAVARMVRDGKVRLDNDTEISSEGKTLARIVGPESELNGTPGVMKFAIRREDSTEDKLEIVCNASPAKGAECEVLCYSYFDYSTYHRKYRSLYLGMNQNGEASVREELYDDARPRSFTSSDYRKNNNENE